MIVGYNAEKPVITASNVFPMNNQFVVHPFAEANIDYYYGPYGDGSTTSTVCKQKIGKNQYKEVVVSGATPLEFAANLAKFVLTTANNLWAEGRTVGLKDSDGSIKEYWFTSAGELIEKIAASSVDMSDYYKATDIDTLINRFRIISFDTDGGDPIPAQPFLAGTQISLPTPTKTGYRFKNWSINHKSYTATATLTDNVVAKAVYDVDTSANYYTVTVTANGYGTVAIHVGGEIVGTSYHGRSGEEITIVASPADGYSFTKWSDGNASMSRTITISRTITYTATFVPANQATRYKCYYVSASALPASLVQQMIDEDLSLSDVESKSRAYPRGINLLPDVGYTVPDSDMILRFDGESNKKISRKLYLVLPSSVTIYKVQWENQIGIHESKGLELISFPTGGYVYKGYRAYGVSANGSDFGDGDIPIITLTQYTN